MNIFVKMGPTKGKSLDSVRRFEAFEKEVTGRLYRQITEGMEFVSTNRCFDHFADSRRLDHRD